MTRPLRDLRPLFDPDGVVVAGASTHPGKFGFVSLHNILAADYAGPVFATNPERPTVLGVSCLADLSELPDGRAELVMVCTPAAAVPDVLRQGASRGVKAAFVASGGFREAGPDGRAAEDDLVALADGLGIVLAGPNGQGLISTPSSLCAQIVAPYPPPGRIAIASQSGNLVSTLMNLAAQTGVGISRAVSAGNAAMLGIPDYVRYLTTDPETAVIIVYLEGTEDGRELFEALRAATPVKPVIIVKGGASDAGARAAASHTGSLATDDRVLDGVLRQSGAVRVASPEDAFEVAAAFATQPLPAGPRTMVVTTAGGWGVLTADALAASTLTLAPLPADLHDAIGALVPPRWSRRNPIDLAGGETRDTIPQVLDLVAGHPDVDAVVYLGLGIQGNGARMFRQSRFYPGEGMERMADFHERQEIRYAEAAMAAAGTHRKPVMVATELATADPTNPGPRTLRSAGAMCHTSAIRAVGALDAMWTYRRRRDQLAG